MANTNQINTGTGNTGASGTQKGAAAALIGMIGTFAAAYLLQTVPEDESGRTVEVTVTAEGDATVRHISGRQYLRAYLDIVGVATACDGITNKIRLGQTFTEADCTRLLIKDLEIHARGMLRCTPALRRSPSLPVDAKDGLDGPRIGFISATYNIGIGGYCGSSMQREMARGNTARACDKLLLWNKGRVRGVLRPVRGLTLRRNRERQMCLTDIKPGYTFANLHARMDRFR